MYGDPLLDACISHWVTHLSLNWTGLNYSGVHSLTLSHTLPAAATPSPNLHCLYAPALKDGDKPVPGEHSALADWSNERKVGEPDLLLCAAAVDLASRPSNFLGLGAGASLRMACLRKSVP